MSYHDLGGTTSAGEFGSMLKEIFEPSSEARFEWERWATLRRRRAYVFSFQVPQATSKYRINYQRQMEIVTGYHGLIFVDRDTKMVQRITLQADTIPPSFPVQQASTQMDYDFTRIGDRDFMLPLRAEVRLRSGKFLTKNDVEFRMYRKFSTETTITFDTPAPLSEDQLKEQPPAK
jgi:hypothetical protein